MDSNSQNTIDDIGAFLVGAFCIYAFFSAMLLFVSLLASNGPSYKYVTPKTVAANAFNLESGKEYPFRYGKRIEGSSGYAEVKSGLFSSYARVSMQPASALSVNYQYGENSYILELPVSKIRFIQTDSDTSSIRMRINDDTSYRNLEEGSLGLRWTVLPYFGQDIIPLEKNKWFEELKSEGQLGPLVQDHFESATIKLSPRDYSKILAG